MDSRDMIDQYDRRILEMLRANARISYSEIGQAVGISRVSVRKRMEAMERSGIIKGYRAILDDEALRKGIRYTIDIEAVPEEYADVVKALCADRELEEVYSTTGDCRIHCIGRSVNQATMESHVNYLFNHTKGIRRISWHILMSDLKKAEKGSVDGTERTEKEKLQGI